MASKRGTGILFNETNKMNTVKTELRKSLLGAMSRESNPNQTPEQMASVMKAVSGVRQDSIVRFINGDYEAISENEASLLYSMR